MFKIKARQKKTIKPTFRVKGTGVRPVSEAFKKKLEGDKLLKSGKYNAASDIYKEAVSMDVRTTFSVMQSYEKLLITDLDNIKVKMSLAEMCFHLEDYREASYELEEIIDIDPSNLKAYLLLSRIYKINGWETDVIRLFESALSHVQDEEILDGLVAQYVQLKEYKKAVTLYEEVITDANMTPKSIRTLAELYTADGQYEKAADTYMVLSKKDGAWIEEIVGRLEELYALCSGNEFVVLSLADTYLSAMKPEKSVAMYRNLYDSHQDSIDIIITKLKAVLLSYPDYIPVLISLADLYLKKQQYSEAVMYYSKLMKCNSRYFDQAMEGLKRVLREFPEQVLARQYLAEGYLLKEDTDNAMEEFSRLLDYNKQESAMILAKSRSIIRDNENYHPARLLMAKCYYVREEYKRAFDECFFIINGNSTIPRERNTALNISWEDVAQAPVTDASVLVDTYKLLVKICLELGRANEAEKYLNLMIRITDTDRDSHRFYALHYEKILNARLDQISIVPTDNAQSVFKQGMIFYRLNNLQEAIKSFQISARSQEYAADSYYNLAKCFRERGRYDLTVNQLNRAYELQADARDYKKMNVIDYHLGLAYEAVGDLRSATDCYERVLESDISESSSRFRLDRINNNSWGAHSGRALIGIRRLFASKDHVFVWGPVSDDMGGIDGRSDLVMDTSFAQAHNDSGVEYLLKGRIKAAEEELLLALKLDSDSPVVKNNLGLLYLRSGDHTQAQRYFDEVLDLYPDMVVANANKALLYMDMGHLEKAAEQFSLILDREQRFINIHINLGDIFYEMADAAKAFDHWERALNQGVLPELALRRLLTRKPSVKLKEDLIAE